MFSREELTSHLPKVLQRSISDDLIAKVNNIIDDPDFATEIKDNLITYSSILSEGRYKLEDYVRAVKFVSMKMLGKNILQSYIATFPERYQKMLSEGKSMHEMQPYASNYNKNKLVNAVFEQAQIPVHILNAGVLQEAINVQVEIMRDPDVSPRVRSETAGRLASLLNPSVSINKVQIEAKVTSSPELDDLAEGLKNFAKEMQAKVINGEATNKEVTALNFIKTNKDEDIEDGEYEK